jgi:hypothetical protein
MPLPPFAAGRATKALMRFSSMRPALFMRSPYDVGGEHRGRDCEPERVGRGRIVALAAANRLPAMYFFREFVQQGGLMSYAPSDTDLFRRAAGYVW